MHQRQTRGAELRFHPFKHPAPKTTCGAGCAKLRPREQWAVGPTLQRAPWGLIPLRNPVAHQMLHCILHCVGTRAHTSTSVAHASSGAHLRHHHPGRQPPMHAMHSATCIPHAPHMHPTCIPHASHMHPGACIPHASHMHPGACIPVHASRCTLRHVARMNSERAE